MIEFTSEINKKILEPPEKQSKMDDKVIDLEDPDIKAQLDKVKQKLNRRY